MSNVEHIRVPGTPRPPREHVTISMEELCEELAKAHDVGYRTALTDAEVPNIRRAQLVTELWASFQIRTRLYEAALRGFFAKA